VGSAFEASWFAFRYNLPVCLPSWWIWPGLGVPSQRGLLLPGFRRFGRPPRRRVWLRWQLGKFHRRDFHPL